MREEKLSSAIEHTRKLIYKYSKGEALDLLFLKIVKACLGVSAIRIFRKLYMHFNFMLISLNFDNYLELKVCFRRSVKYELDVNQ
jgi:hypothetical protein